MYIGRINFRFDSPATSRKQESFYFRLLWKQQFARRKFAKEKKISRYICKFFTTMLQIHATLYSLELIYGIKLVSFLHQITHCEVKKKEKGRKFQYKISSIQISRWKEKERKPPSPSNVSRLLRVQDYSPRRGTRAEIYTGDPRWKCKWTDRQFRRRDVSRWIARSVFDRIDGDSLVDPSYFDPGPPPTPEE